MYEKESREKYGNTKEYKESKIKTSKYTNEDYVRINEEAESIFSSFYQLQDKDVNSPEVEALVEKWQNHISKYFYTCSLEVLKGLGEMYTADERFLKNIDKVGIGTAEFLSKSIAAYCSKRMV